MIHNKQYDYVNITDSMKSLKFYIFFDTKQVHIQIHRHYSSKFTLIFNYKH